MEGLLGTLKEIEPFVTILGFAVTIYLLIWRVPSKAEVNRIADNLQNQIYNETSSRQKQIEGTTTSRQKQIENETASRQKQIEGATTSLQEQIESTTTNLQKQIENETSNLQKQIDKVFTTSLAITNEIREDMRLMQSQMVRLGEKIDANTEAIHADISKLNAKIEVVSHVLQAEVGNRDNQESPSQS